MRKGFRQNNRAGGYDARQKKLEYQKTFKKKTFKEKQKSS